MDISSYRCQPHKRMPVGVMDGFDTFGVKDNSILCNMASVLTTYPLLSSSKCVTFKDKAGGTIPIQQQMSCISQPHLAGPTIPLQSPPAVSTTTTIFNRLIDRKYGP